jgi:hypothetical protein
LLWFLKQEINKKVNHDTLIYLTKKLKKDPKLGMEKKVTLNE